MPPKNAFGTPDLGVLQHLGSMKLPVSLWTAAEARKAMGVLVYMFASFPAPEIALPPVAYCKRYFRLCF